MKLLTKTARIRVEPRSATRAVDLQEVASALLERADEVEAATFLKRLGARRPKNAGERLRMWRKVEGLTLRELAARSGLAYQNLSAIENGRRPLGLEVARRVAKGLGINYRLLI